MGNLMFSMLLLHLLLLSLMSSNAQSSISQPAPAPASLRCMLDPREVKALNNISSMLQMSEQQTYNNYSCESNYYSGITCNECAYDSKTGEVVRHVNSLILENRGLTGVISPAIADLPYLKKLSLEGNELHDSIPQSLCNLTRLTKLDLSPNQLSGIIPDCMENMQQLTYISLSKNFLNGSIPRTLGTLRGLRGLSLHSNLLTGEIPKELGQITDLRTMYLYNNRLSGPLPPQLGNLRNLEVMQLSGNNITGKVPDTFERLKMLEIFIVNGNSLSGPVPNFMANWPWLRHLHLMGTNLKGPFPSKLFSLTRLETLYVSDLRISGDSTFPPINQLPELSSVILRNCSIVGKIPVDVGNMSLVDLDLSFNSLTGEIPNGLQYLYYLILTRNNFSGPFPGWLFQSASKFVDLSHNNFSITIYDLDHMNDTKYKYVNTFNCCAEATRVIHQEKDKRILLDGPILQTFKNWHCPDEKYHYHSLHINCGGEATDFNGTRYEEDNSPEIFSVSKSGKWASSTSGMFITSSAGPQNYTWNKTCGSFVPDDLVSTARISPGTLDYYGLCFRNDMYNVTLSFAEVVYTKDEDYSSLGIRLFDIYIQGERVKKDFNIKAEAEASQKEKVTLHFNANVTDNLLHIQFYWAGKGSISAEPGLYGPLISAISATSDYKPGRRTPLGTIASISVASLGFLLAVFAVAWKMDSAGHEDKELEGAELERRKVTYRDIVDATQNFSDQHKIGQGGSGTVYKAVVPGKGTLAVKKLLKSSMIGLTEFTNEVKTIESLENDNLVQLFGWYAGEDQLWLIYEYMEENSLHRALFRNEKEKLERLSWGVRYRICLQIAKGLIYLHDIAVPKIIHRDITPSNILLDEKFNAKISDFGLARFYNEVQHSLITKLHGTTGYMAPEYAMRGFLSVKTDVYSYGVVILEIVSGKNNANDKPNQESKYLLDQAFVKHKKGELLDLVDENVTTVEGYEPDEAAIILELVMLCTDRSPTLRPTMSEVLSVLEKKKTIDEISGTIKTPRSSGPEHCKACGSYFQSDANTSADGISNA